MHVNVALAMMTTTRTRSVQAAVAVLGILAGCGGGARALPDKPLVAGPGAKAGQVQGGAAAPGGKPGKPAGVKPVASPAVRQALVGEMCPDRGAGRPALAVLIARQVGWNADPAELEALARRVGSRPFSVLSVRGARAGVFEAVGPVDLGTESPVLTGGYAGKSPCEDADASVSAACGEAQVQCGLAVASLGVDGIDVPPKLRTGGACVEDGKLLRVDLDGDGLAEAFPLAGFLDELKAPAAELTAAAAPGAKPTCTPSFSLPLLVRGKDAKAFRALDLVGVVDLDDDGRLELVMQYRYASVRTWAIYASDQMVQRLAQVAEVAPWSAE
jgi:hypothetical protein